MEPFVVTEEGYINYYSSGAMDNYIPSPRFQVPDTSGKGKKSKIREK